jgi:hypothetical protein
LNPRAKSTLNRRNNDFGRQEGERQRAADGAIGLALAFSDGLDSCTWVSHKLVEPAMRCAECNEDALTRVVAHRPRSTIGFRRADHATAGADANHARTINVGHLLRADQNADRRARGSCRSSPDRRAERTERA